ncbi:MAG: histidinol-phosphate transaminase [Christensenellaceae bacterium]|jgi:histidinol-phosphate aminotransferase
MKKYWSSRAAALTPYTAGEQPKQKLVKLNTNENAYPQSPKVREAVLGQIDKLRLYPNPNADLLRTAIAQREGLDISQVFCANGSDEALGFAYMAFFDEGSAVCVPDVTYSFYPVWAKLNNISLDVVPLKADFSIDVNGMLGAENVVIANPNAPTGIALPLCELEQIIRSARGVCIVDEAYVAFGGQSAAPLVNKYDNLVIVRTFSKSHSLAGLRTGYVLANENLVDALFTVKDSFNSYPLDALAQAGAQAALEDEAYYRGITEKIVDTRQSTVAELEKRGIWVLPSSANFIYADFGERAKDVFLKLRENGVLVRYFEGERTRRFLRITIGTDSDMQLFFEALARAADE